MNGFNNTTPKEKPMKGNGQIYIYTFDNGMQYIGQTTLSVKERHWTHCTGDQVIDRHIKTHNWHLMVLGEYPEEQLDDKEKLFIKIFNTLYPNGLNFDTGGSKYKHLTEDVRKKIAASNTGRKYRPHTEEHKLLIGKRSKELWQTQEYRDKVLNARKTSTKKKTVSEETRQKLSKSLKGNIPWNKGIPMSEESKEKLSASLKEYNRTHINKNTGRKASEETRRKLSEAGKGRKLTQTQRDKISKANKGRPKGPEFARKTSERMKGTTIPTETRKKIAQTLVNNYAIRKFMSEVMA